MLCHQFTIGEIPSVYNPLQRIVEDVRVVAVVEAPLQFFKVTAHMLAAHFVERADDGALEQAPDAFDAVGVHVTYDPLLDRVVDRFVAGVVVGDAEVGLEFVGIDGFGFVLDGTSDEAMQGFLFHVRDLFQADRAGWRRRRWSCCPCNGVPCPSPCRPQAFHRPQRRQPAPGR